MSRLFALGGSSIGASTSASVLPVNFQGWFPLGLTGLIYLLSKGISSLLQHHSSKASILQLSAFFMVRLSHLYVITRKTIALITQTFVGKVMYLLFNMLSRFIIAFLPRSKHLLISWLQSPSTVIWEPEKIKPASVSTFFPFICHEVMGPDAMLFVFLNVDFFFRNSLNTFLLSTYYVHQTLTQMLVVQIQQKRKQTKTSALTELLKLTFLWN